MNAIEIQDIGVGYGRELIIRDLSVSIPEKKITTVIGPNGCGKSTLVKTIARILQVRCGSVFLDGKAIHTQDTRELAKQLAVLPQSADAPAGLTVAELVSYGRFPYRRGMGTLSRTDYEYVRWAIDVTGLGGLKDRPIGTLSGGQRQRAWIAMALAQGTGIVVLDEPTTYLDMAHQLEILLLLQRLNREEGRTIVMVLHDLNHASRFSDFLIAMRDGRVVATGTPKEVMTCENLRRGFQIDADLAVCPYSSNPICLSYRLCAAEEGTA